MILSSLLGAWSELLAQPKVPPGTFCHQQDNLFALNFDWMFLVAAVGLSFVGLPLILCFIRPSGWTMADPRKRWLLSALPLGAVSVILFILLPVLAVKGLVGAGAGLLFYPGVDPRYILICPNESFQAAGLLFGVLGTARKAAVAQPFAMAGAFVAAVLFWSLVFWLVFGVIGRRRGVAAG